MSVRQARREPSQRRRRRRARAPARQRRRCDHHDRQAELARRGDLGVGRVAAGVLARPRHRCACARSSAISSSSANGPRWRMISRRGGSASGARRIDGADEIACCGAARKAAELRAADGEKDAPRLRAQRRHRRVTCRRRRIQLSPASGAPGRAPQRTAAAARSRRAAAAALAEMRAAKGCVASTTASMLLGARAKRARPSAPPKPPTRQGRPAAAGAAVRPASEKVRRKRVRHRARRRASANASVVPPRMRMRMAVSEMRHRAAIDITPRPWLSIIGIGEDGVDGLSPVARRLVEERRAGRRRRAPPGAGRRSLVSGERAGLAEPHRSGLPADPRAARHALSSCSPPAIRFISASASSWRRSSPPDEFVLPAAALGVRARRGADGLGAAGRRAPYRCTAARWTASSGTCSRARASWRCRGTGRRRASWRRCSTSAASATRG